MHQIVQKYSCLSSEKVALKKISKISNFGHHQHECKGSSFLFSSMLCILNALMFSLEVMPMTVLWTDIDMFQGCPCTLPLNYFQINLWSSLVKLGENKFMFWWFLGEKNFSISKMGLSLAVVLDNDKICIQDISAELKTWFSRMLIL